MSYDSSNIKILEGLEAVRKRPGMYIGNTNEKGYHHLIWEILDNSIDEALNNNCENITVTITKKGEVIVEDDGRGIPIDIHPKTNKPAIEEVFCKLHAGGKFDSDSYKVSGGLHGVGASVVNALSEYLQVEVCKANKKYYISFKNGGKIDEELRFIKNSDKEHGTKIKFKPDHSIFKEVNSFKHQIVFDRIKQLAFLNKNLKITFIDERNNFNRTFLYKGGIGEYLTELNKTLETSYKEIFYFDKEKDKIRVEIAFQHIKDENTVISSFCNNINTSEGGTHVEGFKLALTRTLNKYLENFNKLLKQKNKLTKLEGDDVREGLKCIISVKHPEPQYEGQTKGKLTNSDTRRVVNELLEENLEKFLNDNQEIAEIIITQAAIAKKARIAAKKSREEVKRKNLFEVSSLPGKLADCASKDPIESELFLVEGDSAGGSAKLGRDREIQAILPLKGKVINVEKNSKEKIEKNTEVISLIKSIGVGFSDWFNIEGLKYHKIIIMTDADVDGSHIRILILTLFFRFMRPLIEQGFVYLAQPPLYKLENKKQILYFYTDNELDEFKKNNEIKHFTIQRYKGLGEMNPKQLWDTTMDPEHRKLIKINIDDAILADETFTNLMGSDVEPRKQFIQENAKFIVDINV